MKKIFTLFLLLNIFFVAFGVCFETHPSPIDRDNIPNVVVSGVYGGGGNSGATYKNDYIELHNTTNATINLEGYTLYYLSAAGTSANASNKYTFPAGATMGAKKFALIKASAGSGGVEWPVTFDFDGSGTGSSLSLSGVAGKVLLLSTNQDLSVSGSVPVTLEGIQAMTGYVDYMPFGINSNATTFVAPIFGTTTPNLTNSTAAKRIYVDATQTIQYTFDVGADFEIVTADENAPRNSTYGSGNTVLSPTFSPSQGTYYSPLSVTISCATDGAAIHYTTDGSTPTAASPTYTNPINVSVTTTIKAMATKSGYDDSSVVTALYAFPVEVPNIAAFKAANSATSPTVYKITGNVTFVYKTGRYFYIKDATAGLLIYDNQTPIITNSYNNGDIISGGVIGSCTLYNGMYELIPTVDLAAGTAGTPVQPINLTMANLLANFETYESQLVKLSNVTFAAGTFGTGAGGNIKIYQDEDSLVCRNNYGNITGYETDPSKHFDVTGFAIPYNADRQIAPRDLDDIKESGALLSGTVTITGSTVFGETLTATANLTSTPTIPDLGAITYQWMRGGNMVGTNSATYTLVQGDVGNKISVTVTAANCSGSVTSAETAVVSKATQTAPAAPTLASKTANSITLNEISGCEYRMDGGAWQTAPLFAGLQPETSYSFEARKAETATHLASEPGPAAQFKTDPLGVDENELNNIQVYSFQNSVYINKKSNVDVQSVKIFDMTGRLVFQTAVNNVLTVIPLNVASGIYHIVLQNDNVVTNSVTKVMIVR